MLNIPEYKEYGGETKIALMDNSSLAFMHELSQRSYPSDGILSVYDLILIPKWVMEEIEDSTYSLEFFVVISEIVVSIILSVFLNGKLFLFGPKVFHGRELSIWGVLL